MLNKNILYEYLQDGFKIRRAKDKKKEEDSIGIWRVGSCGCITEDGKVLGTDPKRAILRFSGIQTDIDFDSALMLDAGCTNEDIWKDLLKLNDISFKAEEEIPVTLEIENHKVTGRPDVVIGKEKTEFEPELVVELKLISSFHTAMRRAHFIDGEPDTSHIIQAATYSLGLGQIPAVLAYSSRVNWPVLYGNPTRSNPNGRWSFPEHRALQADDRGRIYTLKPFLSLYDITWENDTVLLDGEQTVITKEGIFKYYKYLIECVEKMRIPKLRSRFLYNGTAVPDEKNNQLRYDDFKDCCEDNWDDWIAACKIKSTS